MKIHHASIPRLSRIAVAAAGLLPSLLTAAVTPYSWLRGGEVGIAADSSGQNHAFNAAFSSGCEGGAGGGGLSTALTSPIAVGGPLGTTGAISGVASRWGFFNCENSGMWIQGPNNTVPSPELWSLPATNWVMECWLLPVDTGGTRNRNDAQFMSTGSGQFGGTPGGVAFRTLYVIDDGGNEGVQVRCIPLGSGFEDDATVGEPTLISSEKWTHVAAVNDNGVTTFYVNGVATGSRSDIHPPSGVPYIGSGQDSGSPFNGYLDELRYSTFEAGQFSVSDLLLRAPGPGFIGQPQSAAVWEGGDAPFEAVMVLDPDTGFLWKRNGADIPNSTAPEYILQNVAPADTGSIFSLAATADGVTTNTPDATLTVVPRKTEDNAFFRAAIEAEPGLLGFFPIDSSTGSTITNTKDNTRNATLQGVAYYDGRTDRSYGQRAIRLRGEGEAIIPATPSYEFSDGTGSIEALIYLEGQAASHAKTIFSVAGEEGAMYYAFQASADGTSLIYKNDSLAQSVTWAVSPPLVGRHAHVALVFTGDSVTAYADGLTLGTKENPQFGGITGLPARIGSAGLSFAGDVIDPWHGTIDEVAVFGDALSDASIAVHNSRFIFGTAVAPPTITSSPTGTWNLLAGAAPIFNATATGAAPLSFVWKKDGELINGNPSAATPMFTILDSTTASSGSYTVTVSNPVTDVTSPPFTVNFTNPPAGDEYAALVLADRPSGYWRLNEAAGTTTLTDYAGGFNGTYVPAGVDLGIEGPHGIAPDTAARFKDAGVAASVPYTPIHNPTGAFSIEFWAQPEQSGNIGRAILGTQNRDTDRAGYAVYQGFNVNGWEAHLGTGATVMFLSGTTPPVAGRWDHVVTVWNGSNFAGLYVNGRLEGSDTSGNPHRNNLSQPLEIGSRFNGTVPYFGVIDEVAFYNYALSQEQIEKHFSVANFPSSITAQPAAVPDGLEAGSVTLTAGATGFPNTYQWFKDGAPLDAEATNPDGTAKYPQGVTGLTLAISQAVPGDSGGYHLAVTNPQGNSQTEPAAVTVSLDTTPPVVTSVTAQPTLNRVQVAFNKPMLESTVTHLANYTFTGGLLASAVTVTTDPSVLVITTTGMNAGTTYALTIAGVRDTRISQNLIQPVTTDFTSFVLTNGLLAWDYYRGMGGTSVSDLIGDPQFPAGVWATRFLNRFSTMDITPSGALENNPDFGGVLGNNYGARVYGWITPTESADYQFFIRSDDASELWLSSDASPANLDIIAYELACCRPFEETDQRFSLPISLEAGRSYFIEALYKEGGGGDYVEVAWRKDGDLTPAGQLTPIPGQFFTTYAPGAPALGPLDIHIDGSNAILTWSGPGQLTMSTTLATWQDIADATSPHSFPITGPAVYFRLR